MLGSQLHGVPSAAAAAAPDAAEPAENGARPLPPSYTSTAQWVVRHADMKSRFEKIRNHLESWRECALSTQARRCPPEGSPAIVYLLRRRASEPSCQQQASSPDVIKDGASAGRSSRENAPQKDDYLTDCAHAITLNWMADIAGYVERSGKHIERSPSGGRPAADSATAGDDSGPARDQSAETASLSDATKTGTASRETSSSPLKEDEEESGGENRFDGGDLALGSTFADAAAPSGSRSASFTNRSYLRRPAAAAAVHRSPSHPGRRPDYFVADRRKAVGGLQVNIVRKVTSLRSFDGESGIVVAAMPDSLLAPAADRPFSTFRFLASDGGDAVDSGVCADGSEQDGGDAPSALRAPRVLRRPPVPVALQSPSVAQRSLVSPDALLPNGLLSVAAPAAPRLRPVTLHPEFRSMADHLQSSPPPEARRVRDGDEALSAPGSSSSPRTPAESGTTPVRPPRLAHTPRERTRAEMSAAPPSPSTAAAAPREPSSLEDEGIDGGGSEWTATDGGHASPSVEPLIVVVAEDCSAPSSSLSKKKASKRSHTHPPAGCAGPTLPLASSASDEFRTRNGPTEFSSLTDVAADGDGVANERGPVPASPVDSLYGSLPGVVTPEAAAVADAESPASAGYRLTVAEGKPKRVKSDPFPEGYQASGTLDAVQGGPGKVHPEATAHARTVSCGDGLAAAEACTGSDGPPSSDGGTVAGAAAGGKGAAEQRFRILNEIIEKEEIYVANLEQVTQAVTQLKDQQTLDGSSVDKIFCSIRLPESRVHHKIFLESLRRVVQRWDPDVTTIGDRIASMFSSQSVLENYLSYVANCSKAKMRLEQALKTKPNFCKFNDSFRRSNISRQDLRAVLTLPANHLISYRFFIERMLKYTCEEHPDHQRLKKAKEVVLELLTKVGGQDMADGEEAIRTLKKLESLLSVQDLASADRSYLRNDNVVVKHNKRENCSIWTFSDLILITVLKGSRTSSSGGGSGKANHSHTRRGSVTIMSPRGQEIVEKNHHKLWLRLGLEDVDVLCSPEVEKRACVKEMEQIENDLERLIKISEESDALVIQHEKLQKTLLELLDSCNKELAELRHRRDVVDMTKLQLIVHGVGEGATELTVQFESADKRAAWEAALAEAKLNLETALTEKMPPDFKDAIPITKTRAGMQFSCATPVEGAAPHDVWVCNSDSYVGHVCLLSLLPQPGVTMTATVPSCASRVVCACAVPASIGGSAAGAVVCPRRQSRRSLSIAQAAMSRSLGSGGSLSGSVVLEEESASSSSADDTGSSSEPGEDDSDGDGTAAAVEDLCIHETTNLTRNLVWLGLEDGCMLVFSSEENLRTSRVRPARVQHPASVLCIVFLEQAVFVSLGNGSLVVYRRSADGGWNLEESENPSIGGSGGSSPALSPINKMLAVGGKLWCSYQNEIIVLDPHSLKAEISFAVSNDRQRAVQSMACSRHGIVAVAVHGGCDVKLFHAASRKFLVDVNVAAAVGLKLQACDDIIRQHKISCLKVTVLLACKDLLWIGTTAGVILTMPLPKITSNMITSREFTLPAPLVTGLPIGHTGNVRFLTCTDLPLKNHCLVAGPAPISMQTAQSVAAKLLVVSGGDGYENFDDSQVNDTAAGSNDSVNHLLLWEI